jgi:hypothetical protein
MFVDQRLLSIRYRRTYWTANQRCSSPTQDYHGGHVRQNVIGVINPIERL